MITQEALSHNGFTPADLKGLAINFSFFAIGGVHQLGERVLGNVPVRTELTRAMNRGNLSSIGDVLETRIEPQAEVVVGQRTQGGSEFPTSVTYTSF